MSDLGGGDSDDRPESEVMPPERPRIDADSRARTHLANERTFLAWLRTGLSLLALGLGAAQFLDRDLVPGIPVTAIFSAFLVLGGAIIATIGRAHYMQGRSEIDVGGFRPADREIAVAAVLVIFCGVVALVLVLLIRFRG